MRIQLLLSPNAEAVPFNHLHKLTGCLHKWMGPNKVHDNLSLYSFGWLQGGKPKNGALYFPQGARWNLSFYDGDMARKVLMGIINDPTLFAGIRVAEVQEIAVPKFGEQFRFLADGPVLVRNYNQEDKRVYLLHDMPEADRRLTEIMQRKLQSAGLPTDIKLRFDRTYPKPKTKLLEVKGIKHTGNLCPVVVEGPPEAVQFAWLVGAGELTGSGFGALM